MSYKKIENKLRKNQWIGYPQDFLEFIYNEVIKNRPNRVLEFGTGFGLVTTALAMGVKDNGYGTVDTYDSYIPNQIWKIQNNRVLVDIHLQNYNVDDVVTLNQIDTVNDWFDNPKEFDMCFIDIDNNGDKLNVVINQPFMKQQIEKGAVVYFCGGSKVRDEINIKRGEKPITQIDCKIQCVFGETQKNCISKVVGYE